MRADRHAASVIGGRRGRARFPRRAPRPGGGSGRPLGGGAATPTPRTRRPFTSSAESGSAMSSWRPLALSAGLGGSNSPPCPVNALRQPRQPCAAVPGRPGALRVTTRHLVQPEVRATAVGRCGSAWVGAGRRGTAPTGGVGGVPGRSGSRRRSRTPTGRSAAFVHAEHVVHVEHVEHLAHAEHVGLVARITPVVGAALEGSRRLVRRSGVAPQSTRALPPRGSGSSLRVDPPRRGDADLLRLVDRDRPRAWARGVLLDSRRQAVAVDLPVRVGRRSVTRTSASPCSTTTCAGKRSRKSRKLRQP